jgi:Holliday junction resolvase
LASFRLTAIKILKEANQPLHYEEITKRAIDKKMIETQGATPEATMNAIIGRDIKFNKERSPFRRLKQGLVELNPNYTEQELEKEEKEEKEQEKESETISQSQYIGSAGEHRVVSELLFRGYNASTMSVDEGLDIVATKDNKLFNIQVKTANENKFNKYVYDIRKISFEKFDAGNTFYIFILRGKETNFLILPSMEIEKNIQQKNILVVGHGKRYRVNLSIKDGKSYLGNLNNDATFFLNNWSLLR